MRTPRLVIATAVLLLVTGSIAGCASGGASPTSTAAPAPTESPSPSESASGAPVIEPVVQNVDDLQGATVELEIGQSLDIDTGDLAVDSYSGEVADPAVAEFIPGSEGGGATTNPGVTGLSEGSTQVTLSNSDGGIQDVVFTVSVGTVTG